MSNDAYVYEHTFTGERLTGRELDPSGSGYVPTHWHRAAVEPHRYVPHPAGDGYGCDRADCGKPRWNPDHVPTLADSTYARVRTITFRQRGASRADALAQTTAILHGMDRVSDDHARWKARRVAALGPDLDPPPF